MWMLDQASGMFSSCVALQFSVGDALTTLYLFAVVFCTLKMKTIMILSSRSCHTVKNFEKGNFSFKLHYILKN